MRALRYTAVHTAVLVILLVIAVPVPPSVAQRETLSRVVVVGDIHGDFNAFTGILRHAGIIDTSNRWIGSDTTLVQLGDFTDRGPGVRAAMDLLMDLERQATAARGRVAVLLGNHEVMNLLGDLRYVTPAIYETFVDARSAQRRQQAYEAYVKLCADRFAELRQMVPGISQASSKDEWMTAHPLGFVEYREAFGPQGRYGRWLRSKPVVLRLGDTVFLHAGIDPDRAPRRLEDINSQAAAEIRRFDEYRRRMADRKLILPFFTSSEILMAAQVEVQVIANSVKSRPPDAGGPSGALDQLVNPDPLGLAALLQIDNWSLIHPEGPLWFRGFATWSSDEGAIQITKLLQGYKVSHFVVGHTITDTRRITPRFSGAVFLIDTGMLAGYVPGGVASALEIVNGRFTAIYADERVSLLDAGKAATTVKP